MPGTDLNLTLPTLANTMAEVVAMLVTAIEAIEADLTPNVTAGELTLDTELSLGGAPITNVGGLRIVGGETAVTGSIYVDTDGEFHLVTVFGDIQVTQNGAIDVAAIGGIGGDYGGSNPALVSYNDISGQFQFTEDTGVWADLACDDLLLHGTAGVLRLAFDNAGTDYTWTFPVAPASQKLVQVTSAGVVVLSNTLPVNTDIVLSGTGKVQMAGSFTLPLLFPLQGVGSVTSDTGAIGTILTGDATAYFPITGLQNNWRIDAITVRSSPSVHSTTYQLVTDTIVAGDHTETFSAGFATTTSSASAVALDLTPFTPTTGSPIYLVVRVPGAGDERIMLTATVSYTVL